MPSDLTTPFRRRRALLWSLLLLAVPAVLLAHARLVRSTPSTGERLVRSPGAITLWFSERPQLAFTRLRLLGPGGTEVPLGAATALGDRGITAPVPHPLAAGAYVVVWQTGAADGHVTSGRFGFTVNTAPATAAPAAPPESASRRDRAAGERGNEFLRVDTAETTPSPGQEAVTAWVADIALLTVVGAVVFVLVVLRALRDVGHDMPNAEESARRIAQAALVLVFIAMLSRLYMESAFVNGARAASDGGAVQTLLVATTWGNGWLVGAAGALILLVALIIAGRRAVTGWRLAGAGGVALALSPALTGHAVADPQHPVLAVVTDTLHVLGACVWLGTLLLIVLVGIPTVLRRERGERGPLIAALVHAFHPLALTAAVLVAATGVISASLRLTTLADLWTSPYGRTLVLKLGTVACVVLLGAYNWRRLTPTLGDEESPRRFRRSASLELLLAAAVLALTAVLVGTATPERADTLPPTAAAGMP